MLLRSLVTNANNERDVGRGEDFCMKMRVIVALAVIAGFGLFAPARTSAASVPTCHGKKATQWLTAPGTLYFTEGDDVLVGSSGDDQFLYTLSGGVDLVCAGAGNDYIEIYGSGSVAYAGSGNDGIRAGSRATAYAEGGDDGYLYAENEATIDAGPGNDYGAAYYSAVLYAGSGNDEFDAWFGGVVYGGSGADTLGAYGGTVDGGGGNDHTSAVSGGVANGGSGNDHVAGNGAASLNGGSGRDFVEAVSTAGVIDCGSNVDTYATDGSESALLNCEIAD